MGFKRITGLFVLIYFVFGFTKDVNSQCLNDVGTINQINSFIGLSSRHDLNDTIFLCWKDRFEIDHNDDFSLVSDPNKSTPAGIGYGWFREAPTVAGNTKAEIFAGNQEYRIPTDLLNMMITAQSFDGDVEFANDYFAGNISFNQAINGSGAPTLMYYAPMTYDVRRGGLGFFEDDANGINGPCVKVDVDGAFPVVYLNPVKISDIQYNVGGDPLKVSFIVKGGLPEFYKLHYGKTINYTNIDVFDDYYFDFPKGIILTNSFSHGDKVTVKLPDYGAFNVEIEDGVSCLSSNSLNVAKVKNPTFKLDTMSGEVGTHVYLNFSVVDYNSISEVLGNFKYDPTILKFDSVARHSFSPKPISIFGVDGQKSISWSTSATTLSDNTGYFWLSFELIGEPGECALIELDNFFVANDDGIDVYPYLEPGLICINPPNGLYVSSHHCGTPSGTTNGSITFEVFNGVAPYNYVVRQNSTIVESGSVPEQRLKTTVFDLLPGEYIIDVTDSNLEKYSDTVRVLQSEPLRFDSLIVNQPSCFGAKDGEILAFVKDKDFINYNIKWSTSDFNRDTIVKLGNGIYGVTIVDNYGCETDTFASLNTIGYNYNLEIIKDALCKGINDAEVKLTVSGGNVDPTSGYTFIWQSGNENLEENAFDSSTFENIGPGKGGVRFYGDKKYRFCDDTVFFEIGTKYEMEVSHNVKNLDCADDTSGTINFKLNLNDYPNDDFDVLTVWPIYQFNKVAPDEFDFVSLNAGRKIIRFTEVNTGCEVSDTVELTEPTPISIGSTTILKALCGPDNLGSIKISITGGSPPYTCTGMGSDVVIQSGVQHTFNNLESGNYVLYITDASGCLREEFFEVEKSDGALQIDTIQYVPLGCDPNGTTDISVVANSSFGTILYDWTSLDGSSLGTNSSLNNVGPGTYIINLSDGRCSISETVILVKGSPFTYSSIINEAECGPGETGGLLGNVCINVDGGDTGFTYNWSDGSTDKCLKDVQAGIYQVTISSDNGCSVEDEFTVVGAEPIVVRIIDVDGISCFDGDSDGRVVMQASGGNNILGDFDFSFSNGTTMNGQAITIENLPSGVNYYSISYNTINGNKCTKSDSINIDVPDKIVLDRTALKIIKPSCFGDCDGQAIVLAKGGNDQAYYYHWQETGDDGAVGGGMCEGVYHVQITDANNCTVVDSVVINQPEELKVVLDSFNTKDVSCAGTNSGQIKINYTGGNTGGDFTFDWSPDVSNTKLANNLSKGVYTVTVTDEKGCSAFLSHEIKGQVPLVFDVLKKGDIKCYGDKTCVYLDTVYGGSGPDYTFSINGGPLFSSDDCAELYASEDAYLVSVFDSEGCKSESEILITQPEEIVVDLGNEIVVDLGDKKTVHLNTNTNIINVLWGIDTTLVSYKYLNNQHSELEIEAFGNSIITATITDVNGCTATGDVNVLVNTFRNVYIPNIFSPDGDGVNDDFYITIGKGIKRVNYFKIYNRWGEKMHEESNLAPTSGNIGSWDGTFKGRRLNTGAYVYLIEVEFLDGRTILYRGSITLVR